MTFNAPVRTAALATCAVISLFCAGCSTAPADTGDRGGPTGPAPSAAELQRLLTERRASSQCMRDNGVTDFPDPDANGSVLYYGTDPDMESARAKCGDSVGGRP